MMLATSAGVWLFYVQHNFDPTYWEHQDEWEFAKAGLDGSSFYKLPLSCSGFTGNIGFHHIHHLSPKIPNYKLPECHKENPIFHVKPMTLLFSFKSLRLRLGMKRAARWSLEFPEAIPSSPAYRLKTKSPAKCGDFV